MQRLTSLPCTTKASSGATLDPVSKSVSSTTVTACPDCRPRVMTQVGQQKAFLPTLPQSNHLAARMDVALANPTAIRPGAHSPLPGGVGQTSSYNQQDWKDDFLGCALHGNDSGCRQAPCRSPGMPLDNWCPGPESNRYGGEPPKDFKSFASTNFATQANLTAQRVGVLWPRSAKCSRYNTFQTKLSIGPQAATGIHEGARRTTKGHEEGLPSFNDKPGHNPSAIL